jgi:hypothetical protein
MCAMAQSTLEHQESAELRNSVKAKFAFWGFSEVRQEMVAQLRPVTLGRDVRPLCTTLPCGHPKHTSEAVRTVLAGNLAAVPLCE